MPYSQQPEDTPPNHQKNRPASLVVRIDRAANELNPFLMVLAVGLLVLNITLYLGMAAAHEPFAWTQSRQGNSLPAQAASASPVYNDGVPISAPGN